MTASQRTGVGSALRRAGYVAAHTARVAWYTGHYVAGRALFGALSPSPEGGEGARANPLSTRTIDRKHLSRRFRDLFEADRRSLETGEYRLSAAATTPPRLGAAMAASLDYMRDAGRVAARRRRNGHSDVLSEAARAQFPRYFLQNFHFQSDGWLSAESAARYDMQVETLFTGAADVMRRRALPAMRRAIAGRDPESLRVIDLGCGTGGFLEAVKATWPGLDAVALDLSPAYLGAARTRLASLPKIGFRQAPAEATGFEAGSFDVVCSVYLFHELPPAARGAVAAEIARLLKPGGVYIHADTLQYGDDPPLDALLRAFPRAVHEPYYDSYCAQDLTALFRAAGLAPCEGGENAFLTKVNVFRKAEADQASAASARA